jgi:hypothetical protein
MADAQTLVVVPTLGDRLDTLRKTLESVAVQRDGHPLTLALVAPASGTWRGRATTTCSDPAASPRWRRRWTPIRRHRRPSDAATTSTTRTG